ncbi:MAG: SusD/RagB family nutrient-binding outer membrane lipoprotein [Bacteroidetes bacterium]|nr:MAG: SusD/RagB family nutrient-binding outer membrane lipoprotein [Bacteroidota bacterium]
MKKLKIYSTLILTAVALFLSACDLNINQDPNNPVEVRNAWLLTQAQLDISNSLGSGSTGLSNPASVFVHQCTQRGNNDAYGITGADFVIGQSWGALYRAIQNLNIVVENGTKANEFAYVGIAKIMKAVAFSYMVDVWGDIPFSEASSKNVTVQFPKFDKGQDIYPKLFTLIDEGIADLTKPSLLSPRADDLIYAGNLTKWRKFAKSLKLKMYNQVRLVQNVNTQVNALIAENDFIGAADNFEFAYSTQAAPDNRNPIFRSDYNVAGGRSNYISPYFHEILLGVSALNTITSGVTDPRIPYYYFNQLSNARPNAQNPTEYRRDNFVSIYFSSQGPNQGFDQSSSLTIVGLYYCGGRFDDGLGVTSSGVNGTSARGDGALRILPFHSHLYTLAELAQTGTSSGDAKALLRSAILASFAEVNKSAAGGGAPAISAAAINTYADGIMGKYDAADANGKLEMIITQKWIANFGFGLESYNDYRRTGFPKPFDPATDGVPFTNVQRAFAVSMPYPAPTELILNPNAPKQRVIATDKVFWQK